MLTSLSFLLVFHVSEFTYRHRTLCEDGEAESENYAGKPGMTRDDLFKINAGIVQGLVQAVADYCPKAFVLIISNPVNSTVPIAAEVLQASGAFNAEKLFGVTTLDVVRAETFVQAITGTKDPAETVIPVIGGHSGETIVPLFSQAKPPVKIPEDKLDELTKREYHYTPMEAS